MEKTLRAGLLSISLSTMWPSAALADVRECLDAAQDGQKLRDTGAYRRARERFIVCAAEECPGEVRKGCVGWLGEVEKLMPTVVFAARAGGREVVDVRVAIDGELVGDRIDGRPVGLDPGEHRVRFERGGELPLEERVVVLAGEKERAVSIDFGPQLAASPPQIPAAPRTSETQSVSGLTPAAPRRRGASYGLGAVGLAGLASGALLDVSAFIFLQQCNGDPSCTGGHERAEVQWRFVTGDLLFAGGVISSVAAWLLWSRATRIATCVPARVDIGSYRGGATVGVTVTF